MEICDFNLLITCRACLGQQNEMLDLLENDEKCQNLIKMYGLVSDFEIDKSAEISFFMCKICEDMLQITYSFREQCKKSNDIIGSYILRSDKKSLVTIKNETCLDLVEDIQETEYEADEKCDEIEVKHNKSTRRLTQFSPEKVSLALEEKKSEFYKNTECVKCGFIGSNVRALSAHMTMLHKDLKKKWCCHCNTLVENLHEHMADHKNDVLKCQLCGKIFSNKAHITEHLRSHSDIRPYECDVCHKSFNNKRILKVHMRIHTNEKPYKCLRCPKAYTQHISLKMHMKQHPDHDMYFCHTCNTDFDFKDDLDEHECELEHSDNNSLDKDYPNETDSQNCELSFQNCFGSNGSNFDSCNNESGENITQNANFEFDTTCMVTSNTAQHGNIVLCVQNCDVNNQNDITDSEQSSVTNDIVINQNGSVFNETQSIFIQNEELDSRFNSLLTTNDDNQTYVITNEFTKDNFVKLHDDKTAISLHIEEDIKLEIKAPKISNIKRKKKSRMHRVNFCELCDRKVRSLNDHNKDFHGANKTIGSDGKPISVNLKLCPVCGKQFKSVSKLTVHMRIHTGETPYKCRYCDKRVTTRNQLLVHERIHTGEKPHICHVCGKGFAQSSVLNTHMRLHTGRPEQCTICEQRFCRPAELRLHMRKHTGEKPYKCPECDMSFIQSSHLKEHVHVHSDDRPYKCKYCEKGFKQSSSLKSHVQIHMGYKPYKCSQCPYSCRQNYSLTQHMKQHAADAPRSDKSHVCNLCGRGFTTLAMLQSHASTTHANSAFVF